MDTHARDLARKAIDAVVELTNKVDALEQRVEELSQRPSTTSTCHYPWCRSEWV